MVPAREPALALCISNEFCHGLAAGVPKAQELQKGQMLLPVVFSRGA